MTKLKKIRYYLLCVRVTLTNFELSRRMAAGKPEAMEPFQQKLKQACQKKGWDLEEIQRHLRKD